jgi:uncharacterized membrane protein
MNKARLETFSDGVIAIIITVMVLELHQPQGDTFQDLRPLLPVLLSYVLSFVYLGIYWNNHHHMMTLVREVNGAVLWANMHLLFWLSLVPFTTAWMGETHLAATPTAIYGIVLLMAGLAYWVLQAVIVRLQGAGSPLKAAIGGDLKGNSSPFLYLAAIAFAFVKPWLSAALYVFVALMWLIPDRRIERVVLAPDFGSPGGNAAE